LTGSTEKELLKGRDLGSEDVSYIVAFLETLTGEMPESFVNAPVLPVTPFMN